MLKTQNFLLILFFFIGKTILKISKIEKENINEIECPENCDGECPNGICNKCKNSFYGDYCDQKCSERCINKRCDQKTGQCDCINHYSKESNCTKCYNFYDLDKECTECINKYDRESDCEICIQNYDIKTDCTKCKNHYSLDNNCESCYGNYDESTECSTCINHYNISTDCKECELHFDKDKDCNECDKNYNISENCEKCLNYFDIETNCEKCLLGYYGLDCNQKCYEGCNLTLSNCQQKDGKCDYCKSGFYGDYCNKTCNENCVGDPPCDPKFGFCQKCKDLYYGSKCEHKTDIEHCIRINRRDGKCLECEPTYYLKDNSCNECSSNCADKLCDNKTGRCFNCSNINTYGDLCNLKCSKFCNKNGGNDICNREGICYNDCRYPGNFSDKKCNKCEQGFYPIDKGCTQQCSENCDDIANCKEEDGSCTSCKLGFWGNKCTEECSHLCNKNGCNKETGKCITCIDGYYNDKNNDCKECPKNCITCNSVVECTSCIDGNYGSICQYICSSHCEGSTCEKDGKCICLNRYFGPLCENNCKGCSEKGCNNKDGICNDHYCIDNYYDPRMCNETCSEKCENKKCDIFTGECISCSDNKWGPYCNYTCSNECKEDGRLDCCYIKKYEQEKSKGVDIKIYRNYNINKNNNLKVEQNEFNFMNISLGGFNLKILVDFETNSPLVIFDNDTKIKQIESEINSININKRYKSSITGCKKQKSSDNFYMYDGFILTKEKKAEDNLIINDIIFNNYSFLIGQEFKIDKDFDKAGEIDGIVGLGLRNYFTENLFYNKKIFPKNILTRFINNKKTHSIYFGDYPEEIKRNFSKLSTMIIDNKQDIIMDQLIEFETKFTGFAYSSRKAYSYQYDKKVILNNRKETTIIFNNIYKRFFEKLYFGHLF